jgi:hypothetical protein
MKEKRLEILSSIKDIKSNLINNMAVKGSYKKSKEDYAVHSNIVAKQRQYERSKSYEPRLRVHNEKVAPRKTDNHRIHHSENITRNVLDKNCLQSFKEAHYARAVHDKRDNYHGNDRHTNHQGTISTSKSFKESGHSYQVEAIKSFGHTNSDACSKPPVNRHPAMNIDKRAN